MKKWSVERINKWYDAHAWIRGCNYMSADCANRIDQWQSEGFEERFETTKTEIKLMKELGFNSVRLIPEFIVWDEEHDSFFERFDRYLDLLWEHGISSMVVLANDCMPPKNDAWKAPKLGPQHTDWGYHGGRKNSQHGVFNAVGYHVLDDEETAVKYFEMVREIVTRYKDDERIIIWDVYNEPGNSNRRELTPKNLKKIFEICREIDPSQPLTCATWSGDGENVPEVEKFGLENSDIITYHNYSTFEEHIRVINHLKKLGRPIMNTEWLARCTSNTVFDNFPVFFLERIGCYNWGFVAGKYQTYEPYEAHWKWYYSDKNANVDFTKWFHDLYRPSLRPYDPRETELIKRFCTLADKDFETK